MKYHNRGRNEGHRKLVASLFVTLCSMILCGSARADQIKYQVTGLFSPDREQDLREVVQSIPQVNLVSIDFTNAEVTFEYDPAKVFPGAKPEERIQRFDNLLVTASHRTFGVKPLRSVPLDKLQLIEIPVAGLDCKACSLAAYEAVYKLNGVERATASFREGRVTALIDPAKIDRARLVDALEKRGVDVKKR
jgi:copper chaperone CopZ